MKRQLVLILAVVAAAQSAIDAARALDLPEGCRAAIGAVATLTPEAGATAAIEILFADERAKQIMAFDTAAYLAETSEKSAPKRPKLPVLAPDAADALLERGEAIARQPTSWNAVYHILQRYGAWVALTRFANVFAPDGSIVSAP